MNLTSDPDGPWNFENPQSKASANAVSLGSISFLNIKRATVIASNLLPSDAAGPIFFEAHDICCELEEVNLAGIIDPSSSSMDGQGRVKADLLRLGAIEARNLNSLMKLAHFNDLGPAKNDPSSVKLITTDLELDNQRISSRLIDLDQTVLLGTRHIRTFMPSQFYEQSANYHCYSVLKACDGLVEAAR